MVNVGHKPISAREAIAEGFITLQRSTIQAIADETVPKGEVFGTARIAGIMAAKKCGEIIPLCHPLPIESVEVDFDIPELEPAGDKPVRVRIHATARITAQDRRRDGSAHRRLRCGADGLRHVQGDRQDDGDRRDSTLVEIETGMIRLDLPIQISTPDDARPHERRDRAADHREQADARQIVPSCRRQRADAADLDAHRLRSWRSRTKRRSRSTPTRGER